MNRLRINAGVARGRKIQMVPGDSTRPITDRVKQALFNIVAGEIVNATFLDLFAGTGSVGIEALSRGAAYVRLVDSNPKAVEIIRQNLDAVGLAADVEVLQVDSFAMISRQPDKAFDYAYVAPPQYKRLWEKALRALDAQPDWLVEDGWIIAQIHPKEYNQLELSNFSEFDQRKYSNTLLVFYERIAHSDEQR
ncbi:MAG: 16S rRNA (guanine(966)-N(2))-methyltransferase RsmD [Chloroflexi bacterium]|nr:16S rRNA (guanine(966)-N(2))-methyltransferase RsmD [Chloroflexota bacterium]